MEEKLVSVIIPAYNAAQFLSRSVESARKQTWKNIEILVTDDGSADRTAEIARELEKKDARVRLVTKENGGVSSARNCGLAHASGEYVTFLDADDALAEDMIRELCGVLEKSGADFAGCQFGDREELGEGSGAVTVLTGPEIVRGAILQSDTRVWSKIFRREKLSGEKFSEDLTIGEDMLFLLSIVRPDTRYALLDRKDYYYYVNPQGAMERGFCPSYFDEITCWQQAEARIREKMPDLYKEQGVRARLASIRAVSICLVAGKLSKLPPEERKGYADRIRSMQEELRELLGVPGMKEYLPKGYGVKTALLVRSAKLYFAAAGKRK